MAVGRKAMHPTPEAVGDQIIDQRDKLVRDVGRHRDRPGRRANRDQIGMSDGGKKAKRGRESDDLFQGYPLFQL
jgi:hypothetical protein